jgi:ABC-type polysaccharide/polyol phosphate export permease
VWGEVKELWKYRGLLWSMVRRELTVRYKNSFLGFFWSMINPLLTVLVLTFVFKVIQKNHTPNFSAYVLAAYLPYMFFQQAIMDSAQSILSSLSLIKKIYFPREIIPLASIIANYIHFCLALVVFFIYLFALYVYGGMKVPTFMWTTIYLPILLVINFLLATGIGLWVCAINTFYEDVKYLVGTILSLLFFLSPIMYFSEAVYYPERNLNHYFLFHLNPIATLSMSYRKILLAPQPVDVGGVSYPAMPLSWKLIGITGIFSVLVFFYGYHVFNKWKWRFVERP